MEKSNYQIKLENAKEMAKEMSMDFHTYVNYAAAEKFLEAKGLTLITSKRQRKLASIGIMDPHTGRIFAITKAGYFRTYTKGKSPFYPPNHIGTYQLNPRNTHSPIYYSESRVTFPGEYNYMAILLWKSIKRIRKNNK